MRKNIFITADWHFGHANSILFDNRPFLSVEDMERKIIKRFNATVPPESLTYVLGDVGRSPRLPEILKQLNGELVLVLGNHDGKMNAMYQKGFKFVVNNCAIEIAGELVTLSHCPLMGVWREDTSDFKHSSPGDNWHRESANRRFSVLDMGQFHLHGHNHFSKEKGQVRTKQQWDVGVVGNNYAPVSLSQVESWIIKIKEKSS